MLGRVLRRLDRFTSLVGLAMWLLLAAAAVFWLGWETGVVVAVVLFLAGGGPGAVHGLLLSRRHEMLALQAEDEERRQFSARSDDNPTIR